MKILVTGGAGFIGSHLCERLLREDGKESHQVFCVDNLSTGSMENIQQLAVSGNFIFIEHDIVKPLPAEFSETEFDQIYHLASPASPAVYKKMPIETLWVNAAGTKNVLDLAVRARADLLFASTSEVYGDPAVHPQTEDYFGNVNPVGERSCYDEGKRYAESLVTAYAAKHGLNASIVRIFNTYGPRMRKDDGRAVPEFIARAAAGEPLKVTGDGSQTRSFCYVDDMIDGILSAMEKPGLYNLGNPEEITIKELAEKIITISGSSSTIEYTDKGKDDPARRKPDISKAEKELGFKITTSLEDGLKKMISSP
jgi:nucleoside-diphosphate-sugar epimerase